MENLFYASKKLILIGSLLLFFSCAQDEPLNDDLLKTTSQSLTAKISPDKLLVFKGPEVEIGNGIVRSWISVNKLSRMPVEIGIEMTRGALEGLPDLPDHGPTIVLPLHLKAKQLTPFDHIGLNWNPRGHEPEGVFNVPHFDIHFYMISVEDQLAIPAWSPDTDAAFNNYPPLPDYMPADYWTPPGAATAEPQMGKHWLPLKLGDYLPFTKIIIYGSYNGKLTFVEPMITLNFLQNKDNDFNNYQYSQPEKFEKTGNYPTKYNMSHDPITGNIKITLSDFVTRAATPPPPPL